MFSRLVLTALVVLSTAGGPALGAPSHPVPSPSPEAVERPEHLTVKEKRERDPRIAIPKVLTMQEKAWNRGDLKAFMSGYMQSDATTYTAGGALVNGWQALMDRYQARYGNNRTTMGTLRFEQLQITPLGKDYALCVGKWFLEPSTHRQPSDYPSPRPGEAPASVQKRGPVDGVFSLVWLRTADGWKIVHDHSSARTP